MSSIVLKLGTLALRTISKPIASKLKQAAGLHPKFRYLIINFAQVNHRFSTTIQRRIYGHRTDILIRPLNEGKAVQAAADILGEFFVFTVAGIAIIYEVQRNSRAQARKEEKHRQEIEAMKQKRSALEKEVELLRQKLQEVEQLSRRSSFSHFFNFWHTKAFQEHKSDTSF
ncbi:hypothetical protein JCGZ_09821 [Jatropha curcas]|uniref:OPA3-like protein n=1 Tax=Jatropha curcas TaxID=180498 RepID=A0A067KJ75_JATCU|nr:hypothetical protein JCGZ_09821 [Jatropha curcas]